MILKGMIKGHACLGITNAVELSYLSIEEQKVVQFIIEYEEITQC